MQLICELPNNKIGSVEVTFADVFDGPTYGIKSVTVPIINDIASLSVLDENELYANNLVLTVSSNTSIILPTLQSNQFIDAEERCYKFKLKLIVQSPNLNIEFTNMTNIGEPVDLSNVGTYHFTIMYYDDRINTSGYYRIIK